ncbi:TetR family transcriptional regulator [Xanthomonas citri pv. durantae]|uniref:TetR family transcriptional regulator n=1 Tax=Xanthomonas citri pv. durantae TaxID=487862 RepID=A0A9X6BG02_XANCI|nr:TetR family transcriptional regulator [Xanthomonas citri]QRD56552.1 TetR family transcriptional regulator [Xanthomonas citri pv. citri]UVG57017.1 TetR family transcriptional regulator [Xanthomonas citri pv. durantae]CEH50550.1 Transcriptional regulator, TetR family [Xanthomonas citri pv. citri]CEH93911.1 Transcriptional regulator, TetR family [Xanthomonas citri pv. citri]
MTNTKQSSDTAIAKRRKEQVIAAAAECVRREGFHRTSMSQISAAAGMSSGHIHHFFGGKEGIIAGIVAREHTELAQLIEDVRNSSRGSDAVSAIVKETPRSAASYMDVSHAALTMEILAEAGRNADVARLIQGNDVEVRHAFRELLGESSPDIEARCEIVAALLEGLSARTLRNPRLAEVMDQTLLQRVIRFALEG